MDLFAQDSRLSLKPVAEFSDFLMATFGKGSCSCIRCLEGNGADANYDHRHTFEIDGALMNRRFAKSSRSEVYRTLRDAWEMYYQEPLADASKADMAAIELFVFPEAHGRLKTLLFATGVVSDVEGVPHFTKASVLSSGF